ncbi:MAG: tRNA (guanosine(46)-N7)-methyltransferase TrmB [Planctomycetota bacterium]
MTDKFITKPISEIAARFAPESPFRTPRVVELEPPRITLTCVADWTAIFDRAAPLIVEIGCGGGRALINLALTQPELNFLGIERAGEYYRFMRDRVITRQIQNLRVARTDATYLINRFFPDHCVLAYHIYFPDPWPKKRHRKRRLFTAAFCANLKRTLVPNGKLYCATDHLDYYQEILMRLRAVLTVEEHPHPWEDAPEGRTNYEVKYIREGRLIHRLIAIYA